MFRALAASSDNRPSRSQVRALEFYAWWVSWDAMNIIEHTVLQYPWHTQQTSEYLCYVH